MEKLILVSIIIFWVSCNNDYDNNKVFEIITVSPYEFKDISKDFKILKERKKGDGKGNKHKLSEIDKRRMAKYEFPYWIFDIFETNDIIKYLPAKQFLDFQKILYCSVKYNIKNSELYMNTYLYDSCKYCSDEKQGSSLDELLAKIDKYTKTKRNYHNDMSWIYHIMSLYDKCDRKWYELASHNKKVVYRICEMQTLEAFRNACYEDRIDYYSYPKSIEEQVNYKICSLYQEFYMQFSKYSSRLYFSKSKHAKNMLKFNLHQCKSNAECSGLYGELNYLKIHGRILNEIFPNYCIIENFKEKCDFPEEWLCRSLFNVLDLYVPTIAYNLDFGVYPFRTEDRSDDLNNIFEIINKKSNANIRSFVIVRKDMTLKNYAYIVQKDKYRAFINNKEVICKPFKEDPKITIINMFNKYFDWKNFYLKVQPYEWY